MTLLRSLKVFVDLSFLSLTKGKKDTHRMLPEMVPLSPNFFNHGDFSGDAFELGKCTISGDRTETGGETVLQ